MLAFWFWKAIAYFINWLNPRIRQLKQIDVFFVNNRYKKKLIVKQNIWTNGKKEKDVKCQSVRNRKNCEKDKEKKCEESDGKKTDEKKRRLALEIKECIVMLGPKVDLKKLETPNLVLSSKSKKKTKKRKRSIQKRQERQYCLNCKEKGALERGILSL